MSIVDNSQCTCLNFAKMSCMAVGKKVSCKHLYYVFRCLCKVDYANDKFIHTPTFGYNELMYILKLTGVAEQAQCSDSEGHGNIVLRFRNAYVCPKEM